MMPSVVSFRRYRSTEDVPSNQLSTVKSDASRRAVCIVVVLSHWR
jgi:hypothetical protein